MNRFALFGILLSFGVSLKGQGHLTVGNHFGIEFRAPIYSAEPSNPYLSIRGQSAIGFPSGNTVYPGPLLQGTGYTFSVYYSWEGETDPNALLFLYSAPFRTATSDVLPAGLVFLQTVVVPGVLPGHRASLQVRAWNNENGTVTSYDEAISKGASEMFLSEPLGGIGSNGPLLTPNMTGWSSFNIYPLIPEPATWLQALGAGLALCLVRRRFQGSRAGFPER